jgi:hypothetical protein
VNVMRKQILLLSLSLSLVSCGQVSATGRSCVDFHQFRPSMKDQTVVLKKRKFQASFRVGDRAELRDIVNLWTRAVVEGSASNMNFCGTYFTKMGTQKDFEYEWSNCAQFKNFRVLVSWADEGVESPQLFNKYVKTACALQDEILRLDETAIVGFVAKTRPGFQPPPVVALPSDDLRR